jgi:hypothetical protein
MSANGYVTVLAVGSTTIERTLVYLQSAAGVSCRNVTVHAGGVAKGHGETSSDTYVHSQCTVGAGDTVRWRPGVMLHAEQWISIRRDVSHSPEGEVHSGKFSRNCCQRRGLVAHELEHALHLDS